MQLFNCNLVNDPFRELDPSFEFAAFDRRSLTADITDIADEIPGFPIDLIMDDIAPASVTP